MQLDRRKLAVIFYLCFANFFGVMLTDAALHGSAQGGKIEGDRYFVGNKGQYTPVSEGTYQVSLWYGRSAFITTPLGMVAAALAYEQQRQERKARIRSSSARSEHMDVASLRRWVSACFTILALALMAQGILACIRLGWGPGWLRSAFPYDPRAPVGFFAFAGCWVLAPIAFMHLRWDAAWPIAVRSAERQGYGSQQMLLLLRVVTGGFVCFGLLVLTWAAIGK